MAEKIRELPCGCKVAIDYDGSLGLVYCPKHEAAPDLYEALKFVANQIVAWTDFRPELIPYTKLAIKTIDEAIAKADGN